MKINPKQPPKQMPMFSKNTQHNPHGTVTLWGGGRDSYVKTHRTWKQQRVIKHLEDKTRCFSSSCCELEIVAVPEAQKRLQLPMPCCWAGKGLLGFNKWWVRESLFSASVTQMCQCPRANHVKRHPFVLPANYPQKIGKFPHPLTKLPQPGWKLWSSPCLMMPHLY